MFFDEDFSYDFNVNKTMLSLSAAACWTIWSSDNCHLSHTTQHISDCDNSTVAIHDTTCQQPDYDVITW